MSHSPSVGSHASLPSPPASLPNTGGETNSPLPLLLGGGLLLLLLGTLMLGVRRRRVI